MVLGAVPKDVGILVVCEGNEERVKGVTKSSSFKRALEKYQ
jgi:hypothetical protein